MRSSVFLICVLYVLKVSAQIDTGTQPSTQFTSESYGTELDTTGQQTTPRDNYSLRKSGRLNSQLNPQPNPRYLIPPSQTFGARIPQESPGFENPYGQYSINWTNGEDTYSQPSEPIQFSQPGGYPQAMYYPQSLNYGIADTIRYTFQGEPIGDIRNPLLQNPIDRLNATALPISVYPDIPFARFNRRNRFPVPLVNVPTPNFFGDDRFRGPVNAPYPFAPYPFQQMFYPQSITASDEERVDIYMRPPYIDRETGSDMHESGPVNKEIPIEQTVSSPGLTEAEVAAPAEPIPAKYTPQRTLTPNSFPYNIPPAEQPILDISPPSIETPVPQEPVSPRLLPRTFPFGSFPFGIPPAELPPPVPFQNGDVPPIPPPGILPPPVDENLLSSVLRRPQPPPIQPAETGILQENLPPVENGPTEVENIPRTVEGGPIDEAVEINAKIPYEFGYTMNDGLGTDQHRKEVSDANGAVSGSYGYRDPYGVYRIVNYFADKNGFRAFIQSNEPGVANPGSADVTVVAEVPPPKAIEEGLRTLNVNAVEVPLETDVENVEKPIA